MILKFRRLLTLIFVFSCSPALLADEAALRSTIEQFHNVLIDVMKSDAEFQERYTTLETAIDTTFDMKTVSRMSVGTPWRKLDADAKQEFSQLMRELITATYADRFDSFNDQSFEIVSIAEPRPGRWLIRTRLIRKSGKPVSLDYYFKGQRVFNVVADGVSDLAVRRADYTAVLNTDGFQGLLDSVRANIAGLRNES
ncbi:MAG: ABC transporter substrate-binding protein [Pseudomonadales bacterium]